MPAQQAAFVTTHWSVVLAAGQGDAPQSASALDQLCRTYWYPLYAYVRRRGFGPEDAEDLTQAFFAHLLRKDFLTGVGPEKGCFRSFLLACLKHFLVDEWEKARSAKRGGNEPGLMLNLERAEERYHLEASGGGSADELYDRRWALDVLELALSQLRQEAVTAGKGAVFDQLQGCLLGELPTETYAQLGGHLGLSETAIKSTVHRLRQRFRQRVREQIAQTVSEPAEMEAEIRYLFEAARR